MSASPRVVVPIACKHDLTPAAEFGTVVFLIRNMIFSLDRPEMISRLFRQELLRIQFDPERDYVCITPPVIPITILYGQVLSEYGCVRGLYFDARTDTYVERMQRAHSRRSP